METAQSLIQNRLRQALVEMRARNPRMSIRLFAKRLGLPAGTVSLVLLGKRSLSKSTALRFAKALNMDSVEQAQVAGSSFTRMQKAKATVSGVLHPEQLRLSADQFHVLKDWQYYALLNLISLPNESHSIENLANRVGLSAKVTEETLDR